MAWDGFVVCGRVGSSEECVLPFFMSTIFFQVANIDFLLSSEFLPQKQGNRAALVGIRLTTLGEVPRSVSRFSGVDVARLSE